MFCLVITTLGESYTLLRCACFSAPHRICSQRFKFFCRHSEPLNRRLLSFYEAAHPLGFAANLANESSRLREGLADLYSFLYGHVKTIQEAWFNHGGFEHFIQAPSGGLALPHPSHHARSRDFSWHIDRVSGRLKRLDKVISLPYE